MDSSLDLIWLRTTTTFSTILFMMQLSLIYLLLSLHIYTAVFLTVITLKTGNKRIAWLAWIPAFNLFLILRIARKPLWWFLILLIPLVNLIPYTIAWRQIAILRGKKQWVGSMMCTVFLNLIPLTYIAFNRHVEIKDEKTQDSDLQRKLDSLPTSSRSDMDSGEHP